MIKKITTTDLYLAAYLLATGNGHLNDILWQGDVAAFSISAFNDDLIDWADGRPMVNARQYMFKILWLKDQMFKIKKNGGE